MESKKIQLSEKKLRLLQLEQLEILIEFDRICRMNNIKYIIDSGTLLGAVRHKGFIPWDDDIDVRMLRSEYEKFCNAAKDLRPEYFFQNHDTDKGYPWMYAKLRKNGTLAVRTGQENIKMHQGIFIDIFVCDGVPKNMILRCIRNSVSFINRKILYSIIARDNAKTVTQKKLWKLISLINPNIAHKSNKIIQTLFNENNCKKIGSNGYHDRAEIKGMKKEWLSELTELEFEGHFFKAPNDYDECLRFMYGDYMKLPPVEKRKNKADFSVIKFKT